MTSLAWDGTTFAADQGCWRGGYKDRVIKAHRVQIGGEWVLAGLTGASGLSRAMLHHLVDPEHPMPDWHDYAQTVSDGGSTAVVLVYATGVVCEVNCVGVHEPAQVIGPRGVWAGGGGREVVMGALLAGASAQRAIEIAMQVTDYAAHGVTVLTHGG